MHVAPGEVAVLSSQYRGELLVYDASDRLEAPVNAATGSYRTSG